MLPQFSTSKCDIFENQHVYNRTESNENKEIFENIFKDTHETQTMKSITKRLLKNMKLKKIMS